MNEKAKCKNCTDEMIEEMAKDIGSCDYPQRKCNNCWCKEELECSAYCHAKILTCLGYRKIPEGSVVLTSEQYSNYLILQTNEEWLKNKATELQADNERLYKNLGKFKESVRKETAKEILSLAIKHDNGYETDMTRFIGDLKKQFRLGVEE